MVTIVFNRAQREVDVPPDMKLLSVLREVLKLMRTKIGVASHRSAPVSSTWLASLDETEPTQVSNNLEALQADF
jgi:hypothetical protein